MPARLRKRGTVGGSRLRSEKAGSRVKRQTRQAGSRTEPATEASMARQERANADLTRALQELRSYHDDLLASLQDAIIILDPVGRIQSLNPAAEELTGFSRSQVVSRQIGEVFREPAPLAGLVERTARLDRSHADYDATLPRADGTSLYVSAVASLVSDPDGKSRGVVLALRDLSRVRDLEAQVRRSERLSSLGVLAAGVAHEVRNPLVGIRAAAQLLEKEEAFPPSLREFTGVIVREVDRLNRLVEGLLIFAGGRPIEARPCNVNQAVEEALRLEQQSLSVARVTAVRHYDPELPRVAGDPDRLLQVFLNLIRNGAQAMAGTGGELEVRTRFERVAPQCGGRAAAVAEIIDRGAGIPAAVQRQLFTPFFTTKDRGTGLGLPISLRIVEEHGGTMEVQSQVGKGTTVRVLLPVAMAERGGSS